MRVTACVHCTHVGSKLFVLVTNSRVKNQHISVIFHAIPFLIKIPMSDYTLFGTSLQVQIKKISRMFHVKHRNILWQILISTTNVSRETFMLLSARFKPQYIRIDNKHWRRSIDRWVIRLARSTRYVQVVEYNIFEVRRATIMDS